ncbi:MAG: RNA polymerase subunit sigma-70, partial [Clostridia bacterium]|nr:RNA polymerase subunit sigma-70 [Clostridia bacterium]
DLAADYLSLWDIKTKLIEDIEKRGVSVKYNNGGGQTGYKKNESVSELLKVNQQMLKLLGDLGIRAADLPVDIDDDHDEV